MHCYCAGNVLFSFIGFVLFSFTGDELFSFTGFKGKQHKAGKGKQLVSGKGKQHVSGKGWEYFGVLYRRRVVLFVLGMCCFPLLVTGDVLLICVGDGLFSVIGD
jgi:hypothetical protein